MGLNPVGLLLRELYWFPVFFTFISSGVTFGKSKTRFLECLKSILTHSSQRYCFCWLIQKSRIYTSPYWGLLVIQEGYKVYTKKAPGSKSHHLYPSVSSSCYPHHKLFLVQDTDALNLGITEKHKSTRKTQKNSWHTKDAVCQVCLQFFYPLLRDLRLSPGACRLSFGGDSVWKRGYFIVSIEPPYFCDSNGIFIFPFTASVQDVLLREIFFPKKNSTFFRYVSGSIL